MSGPIDRGEARVPPPLVPIRGPKNVLLPPPSPPPPLVKGAGLPALEGDPETLLDLFKPMAKNFVRTLPKILPRLAAGLMFALVVNLVLMTAKPYMLPRPLDKVVGMLVFLFAVYTGVVAKTVFWTLIFTFGRSLVSRIRREGPAKVQAELKSLGPALKNAWSALGNGALYVFLVGGGAGLALCNFLTKNNKINKYSAAIIVMMALIYGLGAGTKSPLFVLSRVACKDLWRFLKGANPVRNEHVYVGVAGIVAGLLGNTVIMLLIPGNYTGYISGTAVLAASVILRVTRSKKAVSA